MKKSRQFSLLLGVFLASTLQYSVVMASSKANDEDAETCVIASTCSGAPYHHCNEGYCSHKPVFPLETSEYVGIIFLPILLGLANVGGIGGGGLIIPLAIGCWGFSTPEAVAISNSTVFMGAVLRYFGFSINEKHPSADKTVIDYNLASIMMPAVMFGAFVGLYLSVMLPAAVTTILLTVILAYMTFNTYKKMINLCKKERRQNLNYEELAENQ